MDQVRLPLQQLQKLINLGRGRKMPRVSFKSLEFNTSNSEFNMIKSQRNNMPNNFSWTIYYQGWVALPLHDDGGRVKLATKLKEACLKYACIKKCLIWRSY